MIRIKSTKQHSDYWRDRKIDWKTSYLDTWNHPHRDLIVMALKQFYWISLWEIGCGPGPNLKKIVKEIPGKQVGGSDINADAIKLAQETFVGGKFHVEGVEDMLLSDQAVDVILSDACLIYVGPKRINKVMGEIKRIARNHVVLCELHCSSWLKRTLYRLKTGYNVYNYKKLLEDNGFYDVRLIKIPKDYWPGTPWETFGHIIIAKKS